METRLPKVSIVMPVHNDGEFLENTIQSVLDQTYENWEILLVDDCSTDNSLAVAKGFHSDKIRIFQNPVNKGAAYSRNVALQHADGDFIAFLDGDDWWAPTKLEKQVSFMLAHKIAFSCTAYYRVKQDAPKTIITAPYIINRRKLLACDYVGCLTAMYDRRVVGLVQIDPSIMKRNDYALWLHVIEKADCYYFAEPLAYYRVRPNSISRISGRKLLRYHYILFRKELGYCWAHAWFCAFRNGYYVLKKRKKYVVHEEGQLAQVF